MTTCRDCGGEIRHTPYGWGHVKPYTVGITHPRHRARP